MSRNPYFSGNDDPILIKSLVAFIDILGYKDIILESRKNGTENQIFVKLYNALKHGRYLLEKSCTDSDNKDIDQIINYIIEASTSYDDFYLKAFTDNIVIGFPEKNDIHICFQEIISKLARFQFEMIDKGFFIRGAISNDRAYIDDIAVFGVALTEAVDGEKEAFYPRLIFTQSSVLALYNYTSKHPFISEIKKIPLWWIKKNILVDTDDRWFINYLDSVFFSYEKSIDIEVILRHKISIENNIEKTINNEKVFSKYVWVAHYHNYFCNFHSEYIPEKYKIVLDCNPRNFREITFCGD
jgi:hypothetical protein